MQDLYSPTLTMTKIESLGLTSLQAKVNLAVAKNNLNPYCVLPGGNPFTCALNTASTGYAAEALYQHIAAYEQQFGLPVS